jgi:hypothetical protein
MKPMTRLSIDSATFTGAYQKIGIGDRSCCLFKMLNNSTVDVDVSMDGIVDHDFIPAGGAFIVDCATNKAENAHTLTFGNRQDFWVKGTAGTGKVYVMGYGPG